MIDRKDTPVTCMIEEMDHFISYCEDVDMTHTEQEKEELKLLREQYKDEVLFVDIKEELKALKKRLLAIENYSEDFFVDRAIEDLVYRYIRAIATMERLESDISASRLIDYYKEILYILGCDEAWVEVEIEQMKKSDKLTSDRKKEIVSTSFKQKKKIKK